MLIHNEKLSRAVHANDKNKLLLRDIEELEYENKCIKAKAGKLCDSNTKMKRLHRVEIDETIEG